jgi:multicomponent Na+:H+ antiporter subunit F
MIVDVEGPVGVAANIVLAMLVVSAFLVFIRLVRGPTLPDRAIALDLIGTVVVSLIAVYAIVTDEPVFVDVAIVLALVMFLGTVAFARYLERRGAP